MTIVLLKKKPADESKVKKVMGAVGGAIKKAVKKLPKPKRSLRRGRIMKKAVKKAGTATKKAVPGELYNSQRAKYEKAMNAAQKKGGSNGVGVGM